MLLSSNMKRLLSFSQVPTAEGLICKYCFGNTWDTCGSGSITCQPKYEHCYSGYYHYGDGQTKDIEFSRGCTNCPNEEIGCTILNQTLSGRFEEYITGCNIECCEEDNCNSMNNTPVTAQVRAGQTQVASMCNGLLALALCFTLSQLLL